MDPLHPPLVQSLLHAQDELRVANTAWHLDARQSRTHAVITHAHIDHFGPHERTPATPETCDLLAHRRGFDEDAATFILGQRNVPADLNLAGPTRPLFQPWDYGVPYSIPNGAFTLHPAGHVLGSAMVELCLGGKTLLYTGDFRLRPDATTVVPCAPVRADVLLMECTYGLPQYLFPPRGQVVAMLCDLLARALAAGRQPICLCYSLGKAQELARLLSGAGFDVVMHGASHAITEIYRRHHVDVGNARRYGRGAIENAVLIAPPSLRGSAMIKSIANAEIFAITGWAMDSGAKYRYQADHAIAFSDHADFDELTQMVELVQPKHIVLTHGFVKQFADHLLSLGHSAMPLVPDRELPLAW